MRPGPGSRRWTLAAGQVAAALPVTRLHPAVRAWAARRPAREPWAVAFSGGADSLALLLLLWAHFPARREQLVALHFNHRLRGRAAAADAAFCQRVCASLGVACRVGRWTEAPVAASEAQARAARFAFFGRELARRKGRVLWLAHHRGDVAESILMRLARGSGTAGLAAPRPLQPMALGRLHARPLLGLAKDDLTQALTAAGVAWREDASNAGDRYFRNRIRGQVLPAWEAAAGRDAAAGAALSRELLQEDDDALEAWADRVGGRGPALTLPLAPLAGAPRAVVRRVLHRWLGRVGRAGLLSRQGFEALLQAVEQGRPVRHSLGSEGFAVIAAGRLRYLRQTARRRN